MFSNMLLAFREGLEAVLVIGIILSYLVQIEKKSLSKFVLWGAITGLLVSFAGGYIGFKEAKELEETGEALFEGIMMLLSSGLIAYFVVWMSNQKRNMSVSIKNSVEKSATGIGLFVLAFLSVFREGIELITFTLTKISENALSIAIGTAAGIALAIAIGFIIFKTSVKLNLKLVFKFLGVVLIFIGAELFGESLVKFIPEGGEILENSGAIIFCLLSLLYFLKDDMGHWLKKNKVKCRGR